MTTTDSQDTETRKCTDYINKTIRTMNIMCMRNVSFFILTTVWVLFLVRGLCFPLAPLPGTLNLSELLLPDLPDLSDFPDFSPLLGFPDFEGGLGTEDVLGMPGAFGRLEEDLVAACALPVGMPGGLPLAGLEEGCELE